MFLFLAFLSFYVFFFLIFVFFCGGGGGGGGKYTQWPLMGSQTEKQRSDKIIA